jgi:hypothetical protein
MGVLHQLTGNKPSQKHLSLFKLFGNLENIETNKMQKPKKTKQTQNATISMQDRSFQ